MQRKMATYITIIIFIVMTLSLICVRRILNWVWFKPKKLEKLLRKQGLKGNSYRLLVGDMKEYFHMEKEARSKPITLSDDIVPRVFPFVHPSLAKYGENSFIWLGPTPRVTITNPELIKDIFNNIYHFRKPIAHPLASLLAKGIVSLEGEQWRKHRKLINPAFHLEKLKIMLPMFIKSCDDLISKWEGLLSLDESCEMDVWPFLQTMTSDVISRTAFESSYKEGRRIFQLLTEQIELTIKIIVKVYIPGWRFVPTTTHRRMKEIDKDIKASLTNMIKKRERALKEGEATKDDLLSILLESNHKEMEEHNVGMNLEEVIEECKLFYLAGQETTASLLVWTMVLLSRYPDWQTRARKEVLQVFGNKKPDFDGLTHLKIVTMILYEVLRLYPPAYALTRSVDKDVKLGNITLPAGVQVYLSLISIHHDKETWGNDAKMFNPERFSKGVSKATNGRVSFFPFGGGPKICIGQNFSMLEAKLTIAMILQKFSFQLSPAYAHAPITILTLRPQYGAHIILSKVKI